MADAEEIQAVAASKGWAAEKVGSSIIFTRGGSRIVTQYGLGGRLVEARVGMRPLEARGRKEALLRILRRRQ